ncbi:MAG: OsmC family protein [Spirochaetota bacterium]
MKITLNRVNDRVHFQASNPDGHVIDIDGAPRVGGENAGFRPMQLVLAAHAGCTAMDLVPILEKQRQKLDDITIEISGERGEGVPTPFTAIHIHYNLFGTIDEEKARRAIDLAVTKYCSVGEMLKATVEITWSFTVNPTPGTSEGAAHE